MTDRIFILKVEISASVRQSTQIKFDDLKLPVSVVDALKKQQSVSVRPTISGKLREFLDRLRTQQRHLYDDCTIHQGDTHFLHEDYFHEAMKAVGEIRRDAAKYNEQLQELWHEEYGRWAVMVDGFLEPLFSEDPEALRLAKEAYLSLFPTKQEFQNPIKVFVLGPNPVSLETSTSVDDHPLSVEIREASLLNTTEVLEAAREGASDRACLKAAELLDDLDVRIPSKVGGRQTGGDKRRGSWEIAAQELELIATHCPGFTKLSDLSRQLLDIGVEMQAGNPKTKTQAHQRFNDLKGDIRNELERIVEDRDSSNGLEVLKKSLALSGTYRDLIGRIQTAESQDQLDALFDNIQTEKDVYEQRARHLQQLFEQRAELIRASNVNLDDVLAEVKQLNPTTTDDCDF
jgi:hypothetical protein